MQARSGKGFSSRQGALSLNIGLLIAEPRLGLNAICSGDAELYDMKSDPNQFTNLATNPDYETTLKQMDNVLSMRLRDAGVKVDK